MTDIRINTAWPEHLKTRKLIKALGAQGPLSLVFLWAYAGENHPDGKLDLSIIDVELAARWDGKAGQFVEILVKVGFLDEQEDGTYSLHDWIDHQPWIIGAPDRKKQAAHAAKSRWDARSMPTAMPLSFPYLALPKPNLRALW